MTVLDTISQAWSGFLEFISKLVIPDWPGLILLLPLCLNLISEHSVLLLSDAGGLG